MVYLILIFFQCDGVNANSSKLKDNIALINTTDLSPVIESAEVMTIKEVVKPATTKSLEVAVTVAQLSSTAPIEVNIFFKTD